MKEEKRNAVSRNDDGRTLLHYAARFEERPEVLEALLAAGADVVARDGAGQTPLHVAAWYDGENGTGEMLLAAGADVAARDDYGDTPLHSAVWSTNPVAIDALLSAGADVLAVGNRGRTPWDLVQDNETLKDTDVYWRMNDARYRRQR